MDKKMIRCEKRKTGSFLLISSLLIVLCISVAGFAGCGKQEEHTHAFTEQNVKQTYLAEEATCTQAAKYYYSCACGEKGTQTFEIGNALGHNFGEWQTVTPATEEKDGLEERTCARCEEKEERAIPAKKHTHVFDKKVATEKYLASEATCTQAAKYYYSCACGEKGTQTFEIGNALGHNFGEWVTVTPATEEKDGLQERTCARCEEKEERAIPAVKHTHVFDKKVAEEKYLAAPATCTQAAKYYYSCACGEKGTQTFTSGSPNGHTYSTEWTYNATEHWHAATCGHATEKDRAKHNFGNGKKCAVCNYTTAKPMGLELQSPVFNIDMANKTAYLKVANAVTDYDFSDKFTVAEGARFDVCTDKECNNKIASKRTDLVAGDNIFYILVTNGNDVASYTLILRRRPIYTVTFNTNGGTAINKQQVEEDGIAIEPATERKGYDFIEWDYDFSTPIIKDEAITASWNIITYKISYELNGGNNTDSNPTTYTVEDEITLALPTKTGYTFAGWSDGGKIAKGSTGDKTFIASYTINQYKVTVAPSINNICTINNAGTYDYNSAVTLSLSDLYLGYEFVGWYNGETLLSTDSVYAFNIPANDITITAKLSVKEEMNNYNFTSTAYTCNITGLKNKTVSEIIIPDSVTSIGDNAFAFCSRLTSVVIPDSVTSIGGNAFVFCSRLENIYYKGDIAAWCKISGLDSLMCCDYFSNKKLYINNELVTELVIPDSVTSIGSGAFALCNGLTSVTIGNGVTSIGDCAFSGCSGLTSIVIPDGVTNIGNSAFSDCSGLTSIVIPDGVTNIGNTAFSDCSGLTSVTIGNGVTSIGYYAFEGCSGLSSIVIPDSVTSIGSGAFSSCSGLESINVSPNNEKYHSNGNCLIETKSKTLILGCKNSVIPNDGSVRSIGYGAFDCCRGLTSIVIPDSVTSIGELAFDGCSGLTSVVIPDSVTSIGNYAFYGCSGLTNIVIPDSVTSIGSGAFEGCSGLESINVSPNNEKYHSNGNCLIETESKSLISGCNNSEIPTDGSVTSIGDGAFSGCSGLTSIVIPDGVTNIGNSAFSDCSGLTSVVIPDGVTSIENGAFAFCSRLTSVVIPDSVTSIGYGAFMDCYKLVEVINNSSLNITKGSEDNGEIAYYALNVKKGGSSDIVNKDGYLFYTYENTNYLLGYIGTDTELVLPETYNGNNYEIYQYAFRDSGRLTSITIGSGVMYIGDWAFSGCSRLTEIHYNGTMAQWKAISKESCWDSDIGFYTIYCTDGKLTKRQA